MEGRTALCHERALCFRCGSSALAPGHLDESMECAALRRDGTGRARHQLDWGCPLSTREIVFGQGRGPPSCDDGSLLEDTQPDLCVRHSDAARADSGATGSDDVGLSRGRGRSRRPSAPAGRLACWKLRSGMHTGNTAARRGSRESVFAARAVEDVISHQ